MLNSSSLTSHQTDQPVSIVVRSAAGSITIELGDTSTSTVEIEYPTTPGDAPSTGAEAPDRAAPGASPAAFIDELMQTFAGWAGGPDDSPTVGDAAEVTEADGRSADVTFLDGVLIVDTVRLAGTPFARPGVAPPAVIRVCAPTSSSVRVRSESASVVVTGRGGDVDVRSVSGGITITGGGRSLRARSATGGVDLSGVSGGRVDVATASGTVRIALHPGTAAKVDLTSVSGTVTSAMPVSDSPIIGSTATIRARSVSGDVALLASSAAGDSAESPGKSGDRSGEIGI